MLNKQYFFFILFNEWVKVLGTTRVGKTRLAEIFITQDIRRGDTVIVLSVILRFTNSNHPLVTSNSSSCQE
jgi:hypothetical protein